ncbi:MFS transporter [Hyphomicrobium sp.]|uniref:MFS transporter n=1 Tax=Hyphomicrobium sp. TaxID=82 RepID=UPI0025C50B63|nr:MFS transporter [Hyphomicrobium sp.]MCC7252758.1 MFS transporter [Hyphomicrobium sp.]
MGDDTVQDTTVDIGVQEAAPPRALVSWVLFDWAAQPYYTLVLTFLFAPYFANAVAADPAQGQALWGYAAAAAGVIIALGSPFLGAVADGRGRRKPWMALFSTLFVASLATLWLAVPSADAATIALVLAAFVVATAMAEFTTVFTNSIMPSLVPANRLGRLSGTGWAVGYAGGLVSLAIMAGLVVADPTSGRTLLGLEPLLALDTAAREGDRLVGPFAAIWYALFMIPFFLFVPDRRVGAVPASTRPPLTELWETIRSLPSHRDMLLFLIARMLYADGLAAIFAFGGIYGAAVFGWGALELGLFGIVLTLTGVFGALIGGVLDDRIGSKTVIIVSLLLLLVGAFGILSVDPTHVLYVSEVAPKVAGSEPFSSTGEKVFLAFAVIVGLVAAPVQAASRALLARLAPPEKMTQYFGLFAFSGKVTAFMAPLLVAVVTQASGSQRIGMASIAVFLIAGLVLMIGVRASSRA